MFVAAARVDSPDALESPALARYFADWGSRPGDLALIAEDGAPASSRPVRRLPGGALRRQDAGGPAGRMPALLGAAWWRFFPAAAPGYGFVAEDIPELGIAVVREYRGRGVGGRLLRELQAFAAARGLPGLSLSVHRENPARALYARTGFVEVGGRGEGVTMLWRVR